MASILSSPQIAAVKNLPQMNNPIYLVMRHNKIMTTAPTKKGKLTCVGVGFRPGDVDAGCRRRKRIRWTAGTTALDRTIVCRTIAE